MPPMAPNKSKIKQNLQMDGIIKLQKPRYGKEQPAMMSPMPRQNEDSPAASQFNTTDKLILEAQQLLSFDNNQFQSPKAKNNRDNNVARINARLPVNIQSNATSIRGSTQSIYGDVGHSLGFLPKNAFDAPLRQAQNLTVPTKNLASHKQAVNPTVALPHGFRDESPVNQRYNTRNTNDPMNDENGSDSDYDANGGYDSERKAQYSLRSMYDFVDVNMNSALEVGGLHQQDGKNTQFFSRKFKEDNWALDESAYINRVTMPNLAANRDEYQKELGLNLDFQKSAHKTIESERSLDAVDEARNMLPPTPFYKIVKKDRIQIIEDYHDRCPFLDFRKQIMRTRVYINRGAQMVMMHKLFENASITVIIINSLFLAMDNPLRDPSETPAYMTVADSIFQYLYTVEMVVKIVSLGFIFNKGSYIRDPWNVLDFTIVSSGYIGIILAGSGVNLSVLRSFRVIRPLRTISTIKGLRIIVSSLINAFPLLRDALLVLLFFHVIFSIAGCQLFMGALKNQCYNMNTGLINPDTPNCGGQFECPPEYFCGKSNFNPGNNGKNFDNVMFAMQQVFQSVTKCGYTATMILLEDAIGRWISIYFYPIIFIGSFFLLNLTLAVIKAKFTEEMENKKEMAKPKKKKLNDAAESSDDEDVRVKELQEKIEEIRKSKNMSPRSKENLINEMKIEHMLWEVDIKVDKRDIELKIMENQGKDNQQKRQGKTLAQKQKGQDQSLVNVSEKIGILQPAHKGFSSTIPKLRQKSHQDLNYSEVYYNNDNSAFIRKKGAAPRYNDRETSINLRSSAPVQVQTLLRVPLATSPIREDEEEHQNLTELVEFQEDREFDQKRRELRRRQHRGSAALKAKENTQQSNYSISNGGSPSGGSTRNAGAKNWLGSVFQINKNGESNHLQGVPTVGDKKRLVFAGMNQKASLISAGNKSGPRQQASNNRHKERVNQAVYDSIAQNFDIFDFADGQDPNQEEPVERTSWSNQNPKDTISDEELQFEIEEFNHVGAYNGNFDERHDRVERRQSTILDLNDNDDDRLSSRESEEHPTAMKRNSTEATVYSGLKKLQLNSSSLQPKYVGSNFSMANNSQSVLRVKAAAKKKIYSSQLVYKGNENRILRFFRGCKQLKASRSGRDFKEEYLLLRKRAKSQEHLSHRKPYTPSHSKNNLFQNNDTTLQSYREVFDLSKPKNDTRSVRAKSIEQRKKRLLVETINFNTRLNIMKRRRAQFFAPALKMLNVKREDVVKEYDEYVFRKRRIKVDPELIDEHIIRKRTLYKSASTDAIFRLKEKLAFEAKMPLGPHKQAQAKITLDVQSTKSRDDILDLESQRSLFLEEDYERIVENYNNKEEEIKKRMQYEYVPDMEKILYERELKIMVKMTNHEYTSIEDVFEKGGKHRFITEQQSLNVAKEAKKKEDLRKRLPKRVPSREIILGYQKKIYMRQKVFHEDLLRTEFDMDDEDQDGMMNRIEHEYNINHRSHIYVTGTVSVVVERPHNNHRILNSSYHANIKAIRQQKKREREQNLHSQKVTPREMLTIDTPKHGGAMYASTINPQIQQLSVEGGSMWTKVQNINFSQNQGTFSQMRNKSNPSKYSMSQKIKGGSSMMNKSQKITDKKPQQLSDALILSRLNEEVLDSKIFKALHIKKLPAKIVRKQEHKILHGAKKRREPPKLEEEDLEGDESGITKIMKRLDYFLDHNVNGLDVVSIARDAAFSRHKDYIEWSGQDVMSRFDPYKAKIAVTSLESVRVWPYAMFGNIKQRRVLLKTFMRSPLVEHSMTAMVVGNTIVLSLDYYGASPELQQFNESANTFFTIAFAIEMGLKILAIGIKKWAADRMNFMDGSIVILSCVELIFMSGGGALSALRSIRIFRIFRILRVARLLRGLKSMIQIVNVISRAMQSFIYMTMLLFLFIFIYALLGMQVFGGTFRAEEAQNTNRFTFDSFNYAFVTSFVLLTMISWFEVLFFAYSSSLPEPVIALYFISCIFIGNWMLLNLLLSILLDSFSVQDEEEIMTEEKKETQKQNMLEDFRYKLGEDFIDGMEEMQQEGFVLKSEKKEKKKKKKVKKGEDDKKTQNILEESLEVDLQELAMKAQNALELKKKLFRGIDCQMSCYVFSQHFWLRVLCYKTIFHSKFETFIMIIISLSSFKLVFDTYTNNYAPTDLIIQVSSKFDLMFQAIFTLEMTVKIIAFGFVMDDGSYLTEAWNKLDCFIVLTGLVDSIFSGINIPFIKVLRLLRILRPLRFVSHSSNMKTLIEALLASMGSLLNVGLVILIVFLMFSILGVNLYAGKTQICTEDKYLVATPYECYLAKGKWETYDYNMDNVVSAIITLFIVANGEVWPEIMYTYTDITGVGTGPQSEASLYNSYFFVFFVSVSTFFFMNLFVGVLFMNFEKAQREEREAMFLNGDEVRWVDMMKMICGEKPEIIKIPKNALSRWCYNFTKDGSGFSNFIMACIILNIFTMASIYEGMSLPYMLMLDNINYVFTGAFTLECILKLTATGGAYFNSGWNKFDFFVVSSSFLDIIMNTMSASSLKVIKVGPQIARIMRVLRVSRLFKLLNKYKGLRALMQTIAFSMPSVMNAFALLTLVYFIFSVLGVFFFKDLREGEIIDPVYMNFENFTQSLILMLRISTGEEWPKVMFDASRIAPECIPGSTCGSSYAPVFFLCYILLQQYIMINLFVLIILQQFDLYYLPSDNVLDRFKTDVMNFKIVWKRYSGEYEGFKMTLLDVTNFFKELKGDLGMADEKDPRIVDRNLVLMNIQSDEEGFVYFNELLYKTMKRRYMPGRTKKKVLFELELVTLEKLENIMKDQIKESRQKEKMKAVALNPFSVMMYKDLTFFTWKQVYELNLPKRTAHMELGLDREISDEEEEETEEKFHMIYQTEEEWEIDELDEQYLEQQALLEAELADPLQEADDEVEEGNVSRIADSKVYDQLKQEDEILEEHMPGSPQRKL